MFFDHYPYTNFHNVNLDWVLQAVKAWGQTVEANDRAFRDLKEANEDFKEYVRNYLQDLDITDEINTKLDNMLASGILTPYFAPYVKGYVDSWLASHVTPTSPALDSTLTLSGAAARADSTGRRLKDLAYIDALSTPEIIAALNRSQVLPGYRVQGITYDYNGHYYVCGGSVDETGTGVIVKMTKPDFTDAEITEIPQLGHANDITYYDGYLYVCTVGGGNAPQWGIYKINVNDFTDKTLISNAPENTIGISYRQGDFWILAPYRIYRTTDFTSYEVVVANTNDLLTAYGIPTSGRISQTIFRAAGYLIGWVCSFVFEDRHYGALTFFSASGDPIAFKMFPAYHTEIQGAVYADMSIYLLADGNMVNVFRMDPRHLSYVQLKAGDDLNSFTGRGTLYSTGSNVSAALLNSPSAGEGFTVQVDRLGVYNTIQTARTNSGRELYRIKLFNTDTWGEWIEPAAEVSQIKEDLSVHRLFTIPNITAFEKGGWSNGIKSSFRQANRARTVAKFYCIDTVSIALKNRGTPLIYIEKYDSVGTRIEVITWTTQATINKGDIVTITLSMGNTGDAAETPLEDIFNAFSFLSVTPVVADTADLTFGQGLISTANAIATFYKTRIYTNEYIPVPDKLIYFSIETGYRAYIVTYDASFNIIDYGVGGWLTGNIWKDLSGARYYRIMVSKADDAEISPSESTALTIKTFPTVKSETLIAISKDGINDSGKDYAPSYPKSSIVSFEKAIIQGFNALELHVQITADGIPVVLHQQNINDTARNPDGTEIPQTVSVSGSTLEQLNQYDFGILYGQKYAGTKILTLEQALKFCKDKGVYAFIEPVTTLTEENETAVCNLLKKYGLQNQCGYFAYDGPVLVRIKNKIPTAMLYIWRNNNAQMESGLSYATANLKTNSNRVFYYTDAETEIAEETIQKMASANIELMLQYLSGEEPVNIDTTGNIYSSAKVTQIVPATSVLGLI